MKKLLWKKVDAKTWKCGQFKVAVNLTGHAHLYVCHQYIGDFKTAGSAKAKTKRIVADALNDRGDA